MEIESTYKPSAGSIGRVYKKVVDFFKKRLSSSASSFDPNKWTYDWEQAVPGFSWEDFTKIHQKKKLGERVSAKIKRFLSRDTAKWTLGDRYELKLKNVDRNSSAFYRCINKQGRNRRISGVYLLDVKTESRTSMIHSEEDSIPEKVSKIILEKVDRALKLKFTPKTSVWSVCNKCGDTLGEQFRSIQCYVEPSVPHWSQLPKKSSWLKLFGSVPCDSSAVPLHLRRKYGVSKEFVQYRSCSTECHSEEVTDRNITSVDELGDTRVMDYIPKGEFLFGEVLPRLLPPVIRNAYLVVEGDSLVMNCEIAPDEPTGVQWHTDKILHLNAKGIEDVYKGRAWLDDHGRFIFNQLEMSDHGMYYCYNTERVLLAVHHVMVVENERTREVIENVQLVLRFVAFVFIFVLVIGQLLK